MTLSDKLQDVIEIALTDPTAALELKTLLAGMDAYTPAVSGDWTGSAPTTIAAALDRIAAALGPIA